MGTTPPPQPFLYSSKLKVFLKILWNFRWMSSLNLPRHWDTGLAPGCVAGEEETNSIPWTREPFTGEVQLLPEKSQKAKAGSSTALIFNNSLV